MLFPISYDANVKKQTQTAFGGLDRRVGAGNGSICDMRNLTSDYAPVLSSRPPRWIAGTLERPNGVYAAGKLFTVDGTKLLADGELVGAVEDSPKVMCALGERVVILPDKLIYTLDGELEPLEASYTAPGLVFGNGTYAGEDAEANSITTAGKAFPFRVGDAVTISGCTAQEANNITPIIREISDDGKTLRFYENAFTLPEDADSVTEAGAVTLARSVPDMDFLCVNENRLWGCKGDTIYASKLGDPYNWNVFDGLSTDAWSVETGSPGDFTGCISFLGYPIFFKEDQIYKVYGSKPSNFQVMSSATLGVQAGSARSLAIAGETLFYLSRAGIMAYSGGIPTVISAPLGAERFCNAAAGSDGLKYYVSLELEDGGSALFVWDTQTSAWYQEDDLRVLQMAYKDGLYALAEDGTLLLLSDPFRIPEEAVEEPAFESMAEFGDFDWDSFHSKFPTRLRLRFETEAAVTVTAAVEYDSSGVWETKETATAPRKRSWYLPVPIRRCDHYRVRLTANGPWKLYAMELEYYDGQGSRK